MTKPEADITAALICTNHLFMWAGSELVAIELAEELISRGVRVALAAAVVDRSFLEAIFGPDIKVYTVDERLDLDAFDLVYAQHSVFQIVLDGALKSGFSCVRPFLVWNHLSPIEPLERPGPFVEARFADLVLANSPETADSLVQYGIPFDTARLWPNPAPAAFADVARTPPKSARVLIVSNHPTTEIVQAQEQLMALGAQVRWIGRGEDRTRVMPDHLAEADVVLTIGKTVQYALRAGRPVYCYGPHGGPGWLDADTHEASRLKNFSGRSHPSRKTGDQIASEILNGLESGIEEVRPAYAPEAAGMALELQVDRLLVDVSKGIADQRRLARRGQDLAHEETISAIAREANLCRATHKFYTRFRALASRPA